MRTKRFYIFFLLFVFILSSLSSDVMSARWKVKKRRPSIKYRDLNIVIGIKKEVYFDFPLGTVQSTYAELFTFDVNKKEDDPKLEKDRIVLYAKKTGRTDLWVYDNKDVLKIVFAVTTTQQNLKRILGFLKRKLRHVEGLKMYIREHRIVLDGEILLPGDIARIHQVITGFENVFKIQYKLSPVLFKVVAEKMEKEIGLPDVHVEVINERFVLRGEVRDEVEKDYVIYTASLYLPKYYYTPAVGDPSGGGDLQEPVPGFRGLPIIDQFLKIREEEIPIPKIIKVVVYFVEIAKGFEKSFNFDWAPAVNTDESKIEMKWTNKPQTSEEETLSGLFSTVTGVITSFIPKLTNAVKHNRGRVIQSSAITIEDKEEGKIRKVTQYPYTIVTQNTVTTQTFDVGIEVSVRPTILGKKEESLDISLKIDISVSQLVSTTPQGPVTAKDVVTTVINMKSNETAAIGGIIQNISSRGFGNIPADPANVILSLSRSKNFQKNKSQFVVFLTPTILRSASEGSERAKQRFGVQ